MSAPYVCARCKLVSVWESLPHVRGCERISDECEGAEEGFFEMRNCPCGASYSRVLPRAAASAP